MSKLSKQDKITSYHLWHDHQIRSTELSRRYQAIRSNIDYLLALIARHGLAILDQPYTIYSNDFKEQALKRIIVEHGAPLSSSTRFRLEKLRYVAQLGRELKVSVTFILDTH
ncbi:hypothetical protein [Lactobacillus sp. ESL0228]|uniref:hypothetical protein n=1 Tax=Lactobacillus sp. ESL0228 TaxID=2069352 RepID=UPI001F30743C|nr:hypothetical protein [Lactobacillus sp. ESL0228]